MVQPASVTLFWIPLGAGGHSVRLNGKVYEALAAARLHRARRDLYHAALIVSLDGERHVVELAPEGRGSREDRGVVGTGPVGSRRLAPLAAVPLRAPLLARRDHPGPRLRGRRAPGPDHGRRRRAPRARRGGTGSHSRLGARRAPRGRDVELQLRHRVAPDRRRDPGSVARTAARWTRAGLGRRGHSGDTASRCTVAGS